MKVGDVFTWACKDRRRVEDVSHIAVACQVQDKIVLIDTGEHTKLEEVTSGYVLDDDVDLWRWGNLQEWNNE